MALADRFVVRAPALRRMRFHKVGISRAALELHKSAAVVNSAQISTV